MNVDAMMRGIIVAIDVNLFSLGVLALLLLSIACAAAIQGRSIPKEYLAIAVCGGAPLLVGTAIQLAWIHEVPISFPFDHSVVLFLQLFGLVFLCLILGVHLGYYPRTIDLDPLSFMLPAVPLSVAIEVVLLEHIERGFDLSGLTLVGLPLLGVLLIGACVGDLIAVSPVPLYAKVRPAFDAASRLWKEKRPDGFIKAALQRVVTPAAERAGSEAVTPQPSRSVTPNLPALAPQHSPQSLEIPQVGPSAPMQLKLKRSQRKSLTGKIVFVLDARMEISAEERGRIDTYRLGDHVIYDSVARRKHDEARMAHLESTRDVPGWRESSSAQFLGIGKMFYKLARAGISGAMAGLSLRITVYGLISGVHVECKDMNELLGAKSAIVEAAENLRSYLDVAATFDGREEIIEF
jgi:hypothetical protein